MKMFASCVLTFAVMGLVHVNSVVGQGCCRGGKAKAHASASAGKATCPLTAKAGKKASCRSAAGAGSCCATAGASKAACKDACQDTMAKYVPSILYRVGEFQTSDETLAAHRARTKGRTVAYMVGDKSFGSKVEAVKACTAVIEENLAEILTVRYAVGAECVSCPNAAKSLAAQKGKPVLIQAAGRTFDCPTKAQAAIAKATAAIKQVNMTYRVGNKELHCPKEAKSVATGSGEKIEYAVGGECTGCEVTAKLLLARAKMRAALSAALSG